MATCSSISVERGDAAASFSASLKQNFKISNASAQRMDLPTAQNTTGITVTFWGLMKSGTSSWGRFFDFGIAATAGGAMTHNFAIQRNDTTSNIVVLIVTGGSDVYTLNNTVDGNWHHYAWSISPNGSWTFWLDNVKLICPINCGARFTRFIPVNGTNVYAYNIGANENGGNLLDGNIDDFRIYKSVLTDAQVTTLYQGRAGVYNTTFTACSPGFYTNTTNMNSCLPCPLSTYAPSSGTSACTPCTVCDQAVSKACTNTIDTQCACNANFYLANPNSLVKCSPCPANTYSLANNVETTVMACRCNPGFTCTYTKTITGTLRLALTQAAFTPSVQQSLIEAIARAAGVDPSRVTITKVTQIFGGGRRLLAESKPELEIRVLVSEPRRSIRKIGAFKQDQLKHKFPGSHRPVVILVEDWQTDVRLTIAKAF